MRTRSFKNLRFVMALMASIALVSLSMVALGVPADTITWAAPSVVAGMGVLEYTGAFPVGVLRAEAIVTVFAKDIEKNIYPNNGFFIRSKDDTPFVMDGKTVRYPVEGGAPSISKDRSSLPATVAKRTDDLNDYTLSEFTTDPTLITDVEEVVLNYNKRMSVLSNHIDALNTRIARELMQTWTPDGAANIVRTTGAARAGAAPSATGNRASLTRADIVNAMTVLNRMDVPTQGRNILLPASLLADLMKIDEFVHADKFGEKVMQTGIIGKIFGMNVYTRSSTVIYDNTGTPVKKAIGAAGAAADNESALIWHENFVTRAKGSVKVYVDYDKPEYYGSVFSAGVRAGGKTRKDLKGVVAIVEAAAA